MKKIIVTLLVALMAISIAACGSKNNENGETGNNGSQIPNPIKSYDTLEEAEAEVGFDIALPEGFEVTKASTISGEVLEVTGNLNGSEITLRKALDGENLSGDYTEYSVKMMVDYENYGAEVSGEAETDLRLATFEKGDYSYVLYCQGYNIQDVGVIVNAVQ